MIDSYCGVAVSDTRIIVGFDRGNTQHTSRLLHLLQVDVVQVVAGAHRLHHPALGGVEVEGEQGRLRHVQECGHGAGREAAIGLERHFRLQHVTVETGGDEEAKYKNKTLVTHTQV